MNYLLLLITTMSLSAQSVFTKQYGKKNAAPIIYTVISAISALIFFVFSSGFDFIFNLETVGYAFLFALFYASSLLGLTVALNCGPLSISSLIHNYSLIIPTLFGMVFLSEPVKSTMVIGIVLLIASLFVVNYTRQTGAQMVFSKKWVIAIIFAFVGNGMCSTVQKIQQIASNGNFKSEFMISALTIAVIILLPISMVVEKGEIKSSLKKGCYLAAACGLANGIVNLLVMILGSRMSISLLFPVITAGSIILSSFASIFIFKEKLSTMRLIGVAIGVVAIVFLNL